MPVASSPQAGHNGARGESKKEREMEELNKQLRESPYIAGFHGDALIGNRQLVKTGKLEDFKKIVTLPHLPDVFKVAKKMIMGGGLDIKAGAPLIGSMPIESAVRANLIEAQVKTKYERMLHPPLTYLGGAFKYRTADGKFNNALLPQLGQAGAPYAKTVPAITHPLGALPDPGDLFDRLMARTEDRPSKSGLSSMLIYHATIIIHDIFRTNDKDKNISDTSSYLDLSPLYGFTDEMQRQVRDGKYKLGLLKPDTFAEDRLLRQPPGVCIMLVMYNRYHNYAATQLRRINENGRFSVPAMFQKPKPLAAAEQFVSDERKESKEYKAAVTKFEAEYKVFESSGRDDTLEPYKAACKTLQEHIDACPPKDGKVAEWKASIEAFNTQYDAAWDKLDDDLFNTARLITCGLYIQISIHDYLRALMGFHQFNTNFTLDPRVHETNCKSVSRGIGNQVTVEFNVLYRFHCAISAKDEKYTEEFMRELFGKKDAKDWDPKDVSLNEFLKLTTEGRRKEAEAKDKCKKEIEEAKKKKKSGQPVTEEELKCRHCPKHVHSPEDQEFGLDSGPRSFKRNEVTNLFDDEMMVKELTEAMDDPISNFGPRNVPRSLKSVEIMGILQARKWEIGTLNDFRQFFGMKRHESFESISGDVNVQNALRDLYEHPDKVELYPGVFCESDASMSGDPGPSDLDSALWAAIFSDAITLVRSDRFYTVDWNTNSLTSWGMKEVTPDNDVLKSSVFHRLIQRAFPEWFPADSVRFFHPFYTSQQNATYAWEQKLSAGLKMEPKHIAKRDWRGRKKDPNEKDVFDITKSEPKKPRKPIYLDRPETILAVLEDTSDTLVHPARLHLADLPQEIQDVLKPGQTFSEKNDKITASFEEDLLALSADLVAQMRDFIKRECITIDPNRTGGCVYQIDIARDFAIPVVTKFVADFLGFGHMIRSEKNPRAQHSENEIYQHITNCQVYLSYNADETKTLKRRKAFKESMTFLFDLTLNHGNAGRANRFYLTRKLHDFGEWLFGLSSQQKSLQSLGFTIAQEIINNDGGARRTAGQAAAILLLVGLDNAYNTVIAFNCVLNTFINGLYKEAESVNTLRAKVQKLKAEEKEARDKEKAAKKENDTAEANLQAVAAVKLAVRAEELAKTIPMPRCDWLTIQELLFEETSSVGDMKINEAKIARAVLGAQQQSVKLPIVRVATKACTVKYPSTTDGLSVKEGDTIVCDYSPTVSTQSVEDELFAHRSSFSGAFARYHPKHLSTLCLTTMIKVVAELKNLRRGHDTQGRLKRVRIDASAETYANYMAPQRVKTIAAYVARERELAKKIVNLETRKTREERLDKIYTNAILRPETATYLTPEWDEMIPFPTTWKLRFDGFGKSDYDNVKAFGVPGLLSSLNPTPVPDSFAPFYEAPGGESRIGGSFASSNCVCAMAGHKCQCAAGTGSKNEAKPPVVGSEFAGQGPALPGH